MDRLYAHLDGAASPSIRFAQELTVEPALGAFLARESKRLAAQVGFGSQDHGFCQWRSFCYNNVTTSKSECDARRLANIKSSQGANDWPRWYGSARRPLRLLSFAPGCCLDELLGW